MAKVEITRNNTHNLMHSSDGVHKQGNTKNCRTLRSSSRYDLSSSADSIYDTNDYDNVDHEFREIKKESKAHNKKKSTKSKNASGEKNVFFWCHQCKQKHVQVICCTRTCSKKYCTRCVWRHYRERVEDVDQTSWICYYCQGVCSCAFCRRRRAKETNTKFESHRGKKRRIPVESTPMEEPSPKKRKLKNSVTVKHEENVIEKIYAKSLQKGKMYYLVKAKNSAETTWILESDLPSFQEQLSLFNAAGKLRIPNVLFNKRGKHESCEVHVKKESNEQEPSVKVEPSIAYENEYDAQQETSSDSMAEPMQCASDSDVIGASEDENTYSEDGTIKSELDGQAREYPHAQKDIGMTMNLALQRLRSRNICSDKQISQNDRRVTLKDLIDSGILKAGDQLYIRNVDQQGSLMADGQIECGDDIFRSLSAFSQQIAQDNGLDNKNTLYNNGWRSVYCRGNVMNYYQKQFKQLSQRQNDSDNERDLDESSEQMDLNDDRGKLLEVATTPTSSPSATPNVSYSLPLADTLARTITPLSPFRFTTSLNSSTGFLQNDGSITKYSIRDSLNDQETQSDELDEQWWLEHEDDEDQIASPMSDDFTYTISCYQDETERDLLVMGHTDEYLDIRDKDFFNITSADDIFTVQRTPISPLDNHRVHHNANRPFPLEADDFGWMDTYFI